MPPRADGRYRDELLALGRAGGLDVAGVAPASPFDQTRVTIEARKAAGLHATMNFTYRNPARSTDPSRTLSGAAALVVGARRYHEEIPESAEPPRVRGTIARYAWRDHYRDLRAALGAVAERLHADGWRALVVADDNALVDREAAYRAGLGWYGKNANLLLAGQGSWFVLGTVITDAPLPPNRLAVADGCGTCRRCVVACPTGAIVAPGVIDARRCLAWVLQAPEPIPRELRAAVGNRIYGCDDCQEVCPHNHTAPARPASHDARPYVDLLWLLAASDAELLERYGRFYIPRREPRFLRRNALVALGNTADGRDPEVASALVTALAHPDAMLRAHAVWAAARLNRLDLVPIGKRDAAPEVRDEMNALAMQ